MLTRRNSWYRQPAGHLAIDYGRSISSGLIVALTTNQTAPVDLVSKNSMVITGTPGIVGSPFGRAFRQTVDTNYSVLTAGKFKSAGLGDAPGGTILCLFKPDLTGSETFGGVFGFELVGGGSVFQMVRSGTTTTLRMDATGATTTVTGGMPDGEWTLAICRLDGAGNVKLWSYDQWGSLRGTGTDTGGSIATPFNCHTTQRASGEGINADWILGLAWDHALEDLEIDAIVKNPWQVFQRRTTYIPLEAAAAAGNFLPASYSSQMVRVIE